MKQRWKAKFLALILVVIMFLGMLPGAVQAAGGTGTTDIWKWKILDDGTLGITGCATPSGGDLVLPASLETGSGPLAVTSIEANAFKTSSPLFFPSDIKTFVMPNSVTKVGDSAFYWCNKMTSVTFSANLRTMGSSAFYNCTKLTSITLPDTLESIGASALANCSSLGEVRLPDNVGFTALPEKLFNGDTLLKTTNIGSLPHLTSIGSQAFLGTGVENITLPNSITVIGSGAFNACWYLAGISLPDNPGFTAISDSMLAECKALQSLTIPASVTSIGADALNGCNVLSSITVAGTNPAFASEGGVLYNADKTILICHPAGRSGMLTIPDRVTEIGDYALLNSSHLTAVSIPDSVERIGEGAFFNCSNPSLTRITLPDSVQSIGSYAFNACAGVTQMTIPEGIKVIGPYTFNGCGSLTGISLPDSLQSIGDNAFLGCDSLPAVSIPAYVTGIGNGAFQFCTDLRKAVILTAGTSFGNDVFKYTSVASDGIYGFESSTAQTYAQAKGFPFHTLYTVSFSVGEGSHVSDLAAAAGEKILKPTDPAQTGYLFGGWYKDEACSDDWDFDSDRVNADTILYAKWRAGTAPTIMTTSMPGGALGAAYSQTLAATGDTPITWSMVSGNLPVGLTLTGGNTIAGIPTASGIFDFTIKAENITSSDTQDLSIEISKTLLGVTSPAAITGVANGAGKTASALGLPSAVILVTDGGEVRGGRHLERGVKHLQSVCRL